MTSRVRHVFELAIPHHVENRVRKWAADNAYTLICITLFFILTWILILIDIFRSG